MHPENKVRTPGLTQRVKSILASKTLTLHQVSQTTESRYGRSSPFFLPHNLYYDIGLGTFTPSLHQLFALSSISNYSLLDWLCVFGFDPKDLIRLQVLLRANRTTLLGTPVDDPNSWIPWYRSRPGAALIPPIVPLGQLLEFCFFRRLHCLSEIDNRTFLYAKLGHQDTFAFPDLLPGSIVRVNPLVTSELVLPANGRTSDRLFLIAHSKGLCCSRLHMVGRNRIIPVSAQLPYAPVELQIPDEVRIVGLVDLEIRSLLRPEPPEVPKELARYWKPSRLRQSDLRLGALLREARTRMALSFRDASAMSRQIADFLGDEQYFTSPGSLSDYEALDAPPRHLHKTITLCAIYGLDLSLFLKSAGLSLASAGTDSIPDELLSRPLPTKVAAGDDAGEAGQDEFLINLLHQWDGAIPLVLRGSLSLMSDLPNLSLQDFFWVGGDRTPPHPSLRGGLVAIVNRRKKKPIHSRSRPPWQQPAYIVLRRDGTYLCASCSLENGTLIVHSYPQGYHRSERLRNQSDAEVVGQIVTVARKLP